MVREFVQQALAAAGVECVEREPGLLRVYSHPLLAELLGEEPWIELVFDEAGHHEYPGATLCGPGSFPLDRILALVQEMPRAFSFHASLPLPEGPPPGGPVLRNAPFQLRRAAPVERTALRLLVRIRLQADETVEHLHWVAASGGRERPDLLPGWKPDLPLHTAAPGQPGPADLKALEEQAQRAAAELAAEYARANAAHQQDERERLERFHQALLEELPSQLPSGPAKRLAQARAEDLALLEWLRSSLPGNGPWERARLLPTGWGPFRKPGQLAPPDYETQLKVQGLLPELGPYFQWEDLERAARRHSEKRLQRQMDRLRSDPEASRQLAEAEERLQEEHRGRLADLERKLHLRTLVTPRALEALSYAAAGFELVSPGVAPVSVAWDPLAGAWEPATCPTCAEPATELWRCSDASLGCEECTSRCCGCDRVEPRSHPLPACAVCARPACPDCGRACADCGSWNCGLHAGRCPGCEKTRCAACGGACGVCGGAVCAAHPVHCGECRRPLCAEHHFRCRVCEADLCPDHRHRCSICTHAACAQHEAQCRGCGQRYCARCVPDGRCETCRTLEPAGEETVKALRASVAEALPNLDARRLTAWKLGRSSRYLIVEARAWPRIHRFVFEEEAGRLLHHTRSWKPW